MALGCTITPSDDEILATGSTTVALLDVLIQLARTVGSVAFDEARCLRMTTPVVGETTVLPVVPWDVVEPMGDTGDCSTTAFLRSASTEGSCGECICTGESSIPRSWGPVAGGIGDVDCCACEKVDGVIALIGFTRTAAFSIRGDNASGGEKDAGFVAAKGCSGVVRMGGAYAAIEVFRADVGVTGAAATTAERRVEAGTGVTTGDLTATCTPILLLDFGVVCTPCDLNTSALGALAPLPRAEAVLPPIDRDPRELGVVLPSIPCDFEA